MLWHACFPAPFSFWIWQSPVSLNHDQIQALVQRKGLEQGCDYCPHNAMVCLLCCTLPILDSAVALVHELLCLVTSYSRIPKFWATLCRFSCFRVFILGKGSHGPFKVFLSRRRWLPVWGVCRRYSMWWERYVLYCILSYMGLSGITMWYTFHLEWLQE